MGMGAQAGIFCFKNHAGFSSLLLLGAATPVTVVCRRNWQVSRESFDTEVMSNGKTS
ncbi:MAG: hypothetical protein OSJ73_08325 [Lachnospiraceae bacterium]|nr:hypothetical protein [Lachnospiraceae bacterium]